MYDLVYDPPITAEDVLDGEELAEYRRRKEAERHARFCRDHFCERCNPPASEGEVSEMPPEMEAELGEITTEDFEDWVASMELHYGRES